MLGSMAKADRQRRTAAGQQAVVIFHGLNTYVSPTCHQEKDAVPACNYVGIQSLKFLRQ